MDKRSSDHISNYGFVITILWFGFVLAIGFLETPLRFRAESITVPLALQIGRLVFHALNYCELVFAFVVFLFLFFSPGSKRSWLLYLTAAMLLAFQTAILFLVLDARTEAVIAGRDVGESYFHTIYIALDITKLATLAFLAFSQMRDYRRSLLKSTQIAD